MKKNISHFICLTIVLFPDSPAPMIQNEKNNNKNLILIFFIVKIKVFNIYQATEV